MELFANSCNVDYDMCMWSHKILDEFLDRICSYPFVLKTERFWYFSWNAHEKFDFHSVAKCIHNHRTSTKILIYLKWKFNIHMPAGSAHALAPVQFAMSAFWKRFNQKLSKMRKIDEILYVLIFILTCILIKLYINYR